MRGKVIGVAILLATNMPAAAQDEKAVEAAVGPQMQAYMDCLKSQVQDRAKSTETADQIVDMAINTCEEKRHDLWLQYQEPPLSVSPSDATGAIESTLEVIRPMMLKTIAGIRGT